MSIKTVTIEVHEGDTWYRQIRFRMANGEPFDFIGTGTTVRVQIRDEYRSGTPRFDLAVGSGITIDNDTGIVTIEVPRSETGGLLRSHEPRVLVSDVELYRAGPPAWSMTYLKLRWNVHPKATRHE